MNLLDFWRQEGLDERDLWSNWDWYYKMGLLQFALNNKNQPKLWLYNTLFNFRIQVRRMNHVTSGHLPATLEEWLKLSDNVYADWLLKRCQITTAPSVTLPGDISGTLTDPLHFPRDSAVYGAWRGLAEAILVIDKRLSDLETERRTVLLETRHLSSKIDHLTKLSFVQDRFASAFGRAVSSAFGLQSNE